MKIISVGINAMCTSLLATSLVGPVQASERAWQAQCETLASVDFSTLEEAPTYIVTAKQEAGRADAPAHCQVQGYVAPQVGFLLALPAPGAWNGKFLKLGCGGDCGNSSAYTTACAAALQKGYACIGSDAGHTGGGGLWASNNLQALVDFGYRSIHVTAVAGKAITERYYKRPPRHSYFMGCSTGGRQALIAAQRFPWDFDGIISGAPWINDTDSAMNLVWAYRSLTDGLGKPLVSRSTLKMVHNAALSQCDLDDGLRDGIIGNPVACPFDPHELVCKGNEQAGCLTRVQAAAIQKVYTGPTNSKGERIYVGGAVPGSEIGWVDDGILDYVRDGNPGGGVQWALDYFRFMVMPPEGPEWKLSNFDFDRDYKRYTTRVQESLTNASNPDLRKFKQAGGKLIIYQGWNDQSDIPQMTIDYYENVERVMGGRIAAQEFVRLFVVPGMLHCGGGDGAFAIDYLDYLETWVEENQPPAKVIGAHVDDAYVIKLGEGSMLSKSRDNKTYEGLAKFIGALSLRLPLKSDVPVTFTRPVYPYPLLAKYKGSGDPNDADNFVPVEQ